MLYLEDYLESKYELKITTAKENMLKYSASKKRVLRQNMTKGASAKCKHKQTVKLRLK